jgi:hypothetical protein
MKKTLLMTALSLCLLATSPARAQSEASELSALSMLPVVVSVAAPVAIFASGVALTVVTVSVVGQATVWVLERASDGARVSLTLSGQLVGGVSLVAGTVVVVAASTAGWVLSAAGQAIAFIPNEIGKSLLYNERVSR